MKKWTQTETGSQARAFTLVLYLLHNTLNIVQISNKQNKNNPNH